MPLSLQMVLDYINVSVVNVSGFNVLSHGCDAVGALAMPRADKCDRCVMQCELRRLWYATLGKQESIVYYPGREYILCRPTQYQAEGISTEGSELTDE